MTETFRGATAPSTKLNFAFDFCLLFFIVLLDPRSAMLGLTHLKSALAAAFALSYLAQSKPISLHHRQSTSESVGYLFTHFKGGDNGLEQVYFSLSHGNDPLRYTTLNNGRPVLNSTIGSKTVRDPSIAHDPLTNRYWTIGNNQSLAEVRSFTEAFYQGYNGIVVFTGQDDTLTRWGQPHFLDVAGPGSYHVWAPEAIWLPHRQEFMIHWSGAYRRDNTPRIYACFSKDFTACSQPFIYFSEGDKGALDMTIHSISSEKDSWVRFWTSRSNDGGVRGQYSENGVFGNWKDNLSPKAGASRDVDPNSAGTGPLVFRDNLDPKTFHVWIVEGEYEAFETENIRVLPYVYSKKDDRFPKDAQQGSVRSVNRKQYAALRNHKKWGSSSVVQDGETMGETFILESFLTA